MPGGMDARGSGVGAGVAGGGPGGGPRAGTELRRRLAALHEDAADVQSLRGDRPTAARAAHRASLRHLRALRADRRGGGGPQACRACRHVVRGKRSVGNPERARPARVRWSLRGTVAGQTVTGSLRIAGRRRIGAAAGSAAAGGRSAASRRGSPRHRAGVPARPRPASSYYGLSNVEIVDGLRAPVVLRTTRDGAKVAARWNAIARCRRGARERLANFTPATRVRPDGSFARSDASASATPTRWSATGCALPGASRPTVPKANCACARGSSTAADAGSVPAAHPEAALAGARDRNHAGGARRRRPSPPPTGGPGPNPGGTPPHPVAGAWSLHLVSEPGDYIGQGGTYDFGPPADRIDASGTPGYLSFSVLPGGTAPTGPQGSSRLRGRRCARVLPITTRPSTTRHPAMPGWR